MIRPALLLLCALAALPAHAAGRGDVWWNFHAIMWNSQSAAKYQALQGLGVDSGQITGYRYGPIDIPGLPERLAPLLQAGARFYLENVATDFYAAYHRYTVEHPTRPTWLFDETKRRYAANPADPSVFFRDPGLSDPVWLDRIAARMRAHGEVFRGYRPLFYDLGDETGIADLAAAWDFDRAPSSLAAMRVWLRGQYPSLAALNQQWGTDFPNWDAVIPPTTTETLARSDANYAAWTDFRSFMDHAFAHALRVGTEALHEGDPSGLAAIEGTQAPGTGGYDYVRLAHAVDLMEMYDLGSNIDIARSLNPGLVVLTTRFGSGPAELKSIWHTMLLGARGLIIWDGEQDYVSEAGLPSQRAREYAPLLAELHAGLGAQLIAMRPAPSPVAILYSPTSQHVQWLLDRKAETTPWTDRTSETELLDEPPMRRSIAAAVSALVHLGFSPHFVSPAMLESGLLAGAAAPRALLLPQAIALSPQAAAAIASFAQNGGLLLADGAPGVFDAHGTRLAHPPLAALAAQIPPIADLPAVLARAGIASGFTLRRPDGSTATDISMRVLQTGAVTLLALESDKPATAAAEPIELHLAAPAAIHDLRAGASLPHASRISVTLDPVAPSLLSIAPAPLPSPDLSGPDSVSAGGNATWRLAAPPGAPAAIRAIHIRVYDPAGALVPAYSGVRVLTGAEASWPVRFAEDAAPGLWHIEATDILGGGVTRASFTLRPR